MKYCDNVVCAALTLECFHLLGKPHYSICKLRPTWDLEHVGFQSNSNAVNNKKKIYTENGEFYKLAFFIVLLLQYYGILLMSL